MTINYNYLLSLNNTLFFKIINIDVHTTQTHIPNKISEKKAVFIISGILTHFSNR